MPVQDVCLRIRVQSLYRRGLPVMYIDVSDNSLLHIAHTPMCVGCKSWWITDVIDMMVMHV